MKYILEPMLFALDENYDEAEFKNFVKRIIRWDRWIDEHPNDVYILSSTEKILSDKLAYPVYPLFQKMMDKYNVKYIKACDLNKTICKLLSKAKKIDKIENVNITDDAIVTNIELKGGNGTDVSNKGHEALNELLWNVYWRMKIEKEKPDTYFVFAKKLSENVTLDVEYQTIEEGQDDYVVNHDSVKIKCHSSLKDFFQNKNTPNTLLSNVTVKKDLSLAIRVSIYQNGGLKKWEDSFDKYDFTIQDSFYKDYCDAHYCDNPTIKNRLMTEISNVLLNKHLDNREDWRKDIGGSSGQQIVSGYYAWRWFVTRSVKMMYWQLNRHYKFANVKEHDIFVCQWEN